MNQPSLFDPHRMARRADPATSQAAAAAARGVASAHEAIILTVLRRHPGLAAHEIADRGALTMVQVCRRLAHLEALGEIRPTGETRATPSGRQARCWEACS